MQHFGFSFIRTLTVGSGIKPDLLTFIATILTFVITLNNQ